MAEVGAERCNDLSKDTQPFRTCLAQLRWDPGPVAQSGGTLAPLGTFQAQGAYGGPSAA